MSGIPPCVPGLGKFHGGKEYVNEYAQKVKEQLKAQKAAEQANS